MCLTKSIQTPSKHPPKSGPLAKNACKTPMGTSLEKWSVLCYPKATITTDYTNIMLILKFRTNENLE